MNPKKPSEHSDSLRRRRAPGSAWHWEQTDAWYYTPPVSKRRVALFDSAVKRIKGKSNKQAANLALARLKARDDWKPTRDTTPASQQPCLVATVVTAIPVALLLREEMTTVTTAGFFKDKDEDNPRGNLATAKCRLGDVLPEDLFDKIQSVESSAYQLKLPRSQIHAFAESSTDLANSRP